MPKSGFNKQKCPCGSTERPYIAIMLSGSSLRVAPRVKTSAETLYICPQCRERLRPELQALILKTVSEIADAITVTIAEKIKTMEQKENGEKPE